MDISYLLAEALTAKLTEPIYFKAVQGSDGKLTVEQIRFLRVEDLASLTGLEPRTIRGWVAKGVIPFYKPRGSSVLLFDLTEVVDAIKKSDLTSASRIT